MSKYDFELNLKNDNSLSIMLEMMSKNSTVLEFGPANGRMTRYMKETLNCTVDIIEIDETAGKEAAAYSRDALLGSQTGDIEKFVWFDALLGRQYDYIVFKLADQAFQTKNGTMPVKCKDRCMDYEFACYYNTKEVQEFSEVYCKKEFFQPGRNHFALDFSDCGRITLLRIEPLACNCIIENFKAIECSTGQQLKILSVNGVSDGNRHIFNTSNPMFLIKVPESGIEKAEIFFDVLEYENHAIEMIYHKQKLVEELSHEIERYKTHYFAAIGQKEDLKKQLCIVNQAYNDILNSECWKLTKPVRVILRGLINLCYSNRILYLTVKGSKSLLTDAPREIWSKARGFTTKRHAAHYTGNTHAEEEKYKQEEKNYLTNKLYATCTKETYRSRKKSKRSMNKTYCFGEKCRFRGERALKYERCVYGMFK